MGIIAAMNRFARLSLRSFVILFALSLSLSLALAAQTIDTTKTVDPKLNDILVRAGQALKAKNFNGARALYLDAMKMDSSNLEAMRNYAVAMSRMGKKPEAIAMLQKALSRHPDDAELHNNLGVTYSDLHRSAEAIAAYQKAVGLDSANSLYLTNLGSEYARAGKQAQAREALRAAMAMDTINTSIPFWMGNSFAAEHRFDSAAKYYHLCIEKGEKNCEVYHFLAVAQRNIGEAEMAEQTLLKGTQADTTCAACFSELGIGYARQGKYIAAQVQLEKAIRFDSANTNNWIALGTSYYMTEMFAKSDSVAWHLRQIDSNLVHRMLVLINTEVQKKNKGKGKGK